MRKKQIISFGIFILIIFAITGFQFAYRYQHAQIGFYDLKFDRIKSEAYFRVYFNKKSQWKRLEGADDFRKAKLILEDKYINLTINNNDSSIMDDIDSRVDEIESRIDDLESRLSQIESHRL